MRILTPLLIFSFLATSFVRAAEPLAHPQFKDNPLTEKKWNPPTQESPNSFKKQSDNDETITLHTAFPTKEGVARVDQEEKLEEVQKKADVFIRSLMLLKAAPLNLITQEQKEDKKKGDIWPYSMATVFGHGQRVLITAPDFPIKKLLSWLFTGNEKAKDYPSFVKKRSISSHGVEKKGKNFEEVKLGNVSGAVKNLFKGALGQHLYVNMSWGGPGEVGPDGLLNDTSGHRYNPKTKERDNKTKLGHLYIYWDDMDGDAVILIGVETCSPGSSNPYGVSHNISSGMSDASKNRAVNGGSKWKALLGPKDVPAEYGGMRAQLTSKEIERAQKEWEAYQDLSIKDKVSYMKDLLQNNAAGEEPSYPKTPSKKGQSED